MTTFAKRITAARKEKKLTQEQVAQAMGVSRQTVSHWENGRVEPTQEQREALCRLLEIPADAPQPTPLRRRILAAVALIAFVTILVMAVYPIYKSRHAGANLEAAQETPIPQSEKYSWDWFQQPDAQPVEGQANIELTTAENADMRIIPCSISSQENVNDFKPTPKDADGAAALLARLDKLNAQFEKAFAKTGVTAVSPYPTAWTYAY